MRRKVRNGRTFGFTRRDQSAAATTARRGRSVLSGVGELYPGENEDFPTRHAEIAHEFGVIPRSRICLNAGCNDRDDHLILGELALYLARTMAGVIDFNGPLLPSSALRLAGVTNVRWLFEEAQWGDVTPRVDQCLRSLPGKIVGIRYRTAGARSWVTHLCDVDFMEAWLHHPDFYMCK